MDEKKSSYTTTDEYIARCPPEVQPILQEMRRVIKEAAPQAKEKISYGMPGFDLKGNLVWFAAHRNHIGFYPRGNGAIEAFKDELSGYQVSKGTIQFPLDKPMPYDLIRKIVKYRAAENLKKK